MEYQRKIMLTVIFNSMGKCINSLAGQENSLLLLFCGIMRTFYIFLKMKPLQANNKKIIYIFMNRCFKYFCKLYKILIFA